MELLNNNTVKNRPNYPIKIIQFGEGNFLRAFVDWMIELLNRETAFDAGICVVQPIKEGMLQLLKEQDGLYHVWLNGLSKGQVVNETTLVKSIVKCVNPYENYSSFLHLAENKELRFLFSNTTESGIVFDPNDSTLDTLPKSFPGKLTALLYQRYKHFSADQSKGLIIVPCELIDKNGDTLRSTVLEYAKHFKLPQAFANWVLEANYFCNTLVDRIVPGYPRESIDEIQERLQYEDQLVVKAEPFHLWVIEGDEIVRKEFPTDELNLQVKFVPNLSPYRTRKVRILNGAHTAIVHRAYLEGLKTVEEITKDSAMSSLLEKIIFEEIIPTLDLPKRELEEFAHDVLERFRNPFIRHELLSITLNSISKFKVRVLPSILSYYNKYKQWPKHLVQSFAALFVFYRGEWRNSSIELKDSEEVINTLKKAWDHNNFQLDSILSNVALWGQDLSVLDGLGNQIQTEINNLLKKEAKQA